MHADKRCHGRIATTGFEPHLLKFFDSLKFQQNVAKFCKIGSLYHPEFSFMLKTPNVRKKENWPFYKMTNHEVIDPLVTQSCDIPVEDSTFCEFAPLI